jgi:hypothetical protein
MWLRHLRRLWLRDIPCAPRGRTPPRPAVELLEDRTVPTVPPVTSFTDSSAAGSGSLRAAILAANADLGTADDVITLSAGTYALTLQHSGPRTNDGRDGALAAHSAP